MVVALDEEISGLSQDVLQFAGLIFTNCEKMKIKLKHRH